jgi:hypothetical protein
LILISLLFFWEVARKTNTLFVMPTDCRNSVRVNIVLSIVVQGEEKKKVNQTWKTVDNGVGGGGALEFLVEGTQTLSPNSQPTANRGTTAAWKRGKRGATSSSQQQHKKKRLSNHAKLIKAQNSTACKNNDEEFRRRVQDVKEKCRDVQKKGMVSPFVSLVILSCCCWRVCVCVSVCACSFVHTPRRHFELIVCVRVIFV